MFGVGSGKRTKVKWTTSQDDTWCKKVTLLLFLASLAASLAASCKETAGKHSYKVMVLCCKSKDNTFCSAKRDIMIYIYTIYVIICIYPIAPKKACTLYMYFYISYYC